MFDSCSDPAVLAGFAGVLLVLRPGTEAISPYAVMVLLSALVLAAVALLIKRLTTTESATTIVLYQSLFMTAMSVPLALLTWRTPALAEVARRDEVVVEVAGAVAVEGDVGRALAGAARLDAAHVGPLGDAGDRGGHVLEALASVARDVDLAVVGACPQDPGAERRLGERRGRAPVHDAVVARDEVLGGLAEDLQRVALLAERQVLAHDDVVRRRAERSGGDLPVARAHVVGLAAGFRRSDGV